MNTINQYFLINDHTHTNYVFELVRAKKCHFISPTLTIAKEGD